MNDLAETVGSMFEERPFSSCKALYPHSRIGKATCLWIHYDEPGLKVPSSLGVARPIDQPEEQKSVIFDARSDAIDGTESERLSTNHHRR
jgi:hypothetical protein